MAIPFNTANGCASPVISTHRPLLQRWWLDLRQLWTNWRVQARREQEWRSLEGLSDSTLRDIGLGERQLPRHTLPLVDYERGRW